MTSDRPSTGAAQSLPHSHHNYFGVVLLLLASGIFCLLPGPVTLAAEFEPVCPRDGWESYDEEEGL